MKLPDEVAKELQSHPTFEAFEVIARHCAKVCASNHYVSGGPGPLFAAGWNSANEADSNAILKEFGLE